jgi:hypothetical protein
LSYAEAPYFPCNRLARPEKPLVLPATARSPVCASERVWKSGLVQIKVTTWGR